MFYQKITFSFKACHYFCYKVVKIFASDFVVNDDVMQNESQLLKND